MVLSGHKRFFQNRNTIVVILYTVIFLFAGFVLFYNLGDRLLWDDEAERALLAQNIVKFGVPKVTDGKNFLTNLGPDHDSNKQLIWTWTPWLDKYIVAASFVLLGKSTLSARIPFSLIAFLSVLLLAFTAHRVFNSHEVTFFVILLYMTNIAFLLHARQCNYYAIVMFSQVWLIYGYWLLFTGRSYWRILHLSLPLAIQFYCNYFTAAGNVISLFCAVLFVRSHRTQLFWILSLSIGIFAFIAAPWILYVQLWQGTKNVGIHYFFPKMLFYILKIHFHIVPLLILLIPAVVYIILLSRRHFRNSYHAHRDSHQKVMDPRQNIEVFLWILPVAHLLVLCTVKYAFFRYIVQLIPGLLLLTVIILNRYVRSRAARIFLIAILCVSNFFSVGTAWFWAESRQFKMPIVRFLQEITTHYEDRLGDIVAFFKDNSDPDDSVYAFDNELALIFYTDLQIIDSRFNRQRVTPGNLPDWILTKSSTGMVNYPPVKLPDPLRQYYEPITISVHDTHGFASRPDPSVHVPFTVPKSTDIVIYKKVR